MKSTKGSKQQQSNQKGEQNQTTQYVITPLQSTYLISSTLIGIGVLTLPRITAQYANETAWLPVLLGTLVSLLFMIIITKVALRFPKKTFVEYSIIILGSQKRKTLTKLFVAPILSFVAIVWLAGAAITARGFSEVVISAVLQETPFQVIIGTLLIAVGILVLYEIEVLARFNEIVYPLIIVPLLLITILSLKNGQIINLFPLFVFDWNSFLIGLVNSAIAFQGFSIVFIFMAFTQKSKNIRANSAGILLTGFSYILIVISCLAVFGYEELKDIIWPTLELVKTTEIPGRVLERLESAFLGVWVVAVFTSVGNIYYSACFTLSEILPFKKKNKTRKWLAILLLPVIFFIAVTPKSLFVVFKWSTYIGYLGFFAMIILPFILWTLAILRKKREDQPSQ